MKADTKRQVTMKMILSCTQCGENGNQRNISKFLVSIRRYG